MFVGYFEISISVTVKHVQSIGNIRAFSFFLPGGTCYDFQCLGRQKKLLGCGLRGGGPAPRLTLWVLVGKKGMTSLRRGGGCNFCVKNKLKSEIFNDKKCL